MKKYGSPSYRGKGQSQRMRNGDLILYASLDGRFWTDESCVAYLRHPDGKMIDTMRVGRPPRHPYGH